MEWSTPHFLDPLCDVAALLADAPLPAGLESAAAPLGHIRALPAMGDPAATMQVLVAELVSHVRDASGQIQRVDQACGSVCPALSADFTTLRADACDLLARWLVEVAPAMRRELIRLSRGRTLLALNSLRPELRSLSAMSLRRAAYWPSWTLSVLASRLPNIRCGTGWSARCRFMRSIQVHFRSRMIVGRQLKSIPPGSIPSVVFGIRAPAALAQWSFGQLKMR